MGLDLVISEILDSFRRKEDILCIQSDCLSVMLKYKSFRSPAVALERTIRILQNNILSFILNIAKNTNEFFKLFVINVTGAFMCN